ncbi:TetR/AcrR family transcriptional regulator [Paenibacillus sp. LMG 31460]|uniref:TetR/AcrR family transcriptional regulator n=1 Tax=Paenibacillus germinis TaxID=2654979 RepID=A0ABX1ZEH5_9BACL|nr:TetR/AcrR family transcriptional regulator [Paenibacillus germinis]
MTSKSKVDRRILKTQEALKKAVKYDLLDKPIETHINELREMCKAAADMDFINGSLIWTEYFDNNYTFFSMMLTSQGAPYFRNQFLDFLLEEFKDEVDVTSGINQGFNEDVIVRFVASAYVGIVEYWFTNEKPFPHHVLAEQMGTLLDLKKPIFLQRNFGYFLFSSNAQSEASPFF